MHPMKSIQSYGPAELAQGPLFIGLFFNILLYGIMVSQTYVYFTTFRNDKTWTKTFVACIFVLDTLNTLFDFAYLYDSLIIHFGDVPFLDHANWLFATDPAMTAIIATLVQLFFAWRVKVLTRNNWLVVFVVACSLTGLAGGIGTSIEVLRMPHFRDFTHFKSVVIVWLAAECVGDIFITAILVFHLKSHKSGFEGSDILVDRIIRMTVQTGLATALCATLDLILFLTDPIAWHLSFNIPLCKLYTNFLLSSLNARTALGAGSAGSGHTGLMVSKRLSMPPPPQFRSSIFIEVDSVRVSDSVSPIRVSDVSQVQEVV
ncbi:hypothetical protein C8R44DRAFT_781067 [Mycena epipterygia]|nr:hypothetical protein C8R44DRAFT_781067 [Mycena epipterygia]